MGYTRKFLDKIINSYTKEPYIGKDSIYWAVEIFDKDGIKIGNCVMRKYPDMYNQTPRIANYSDFLPWCGWGINPELRESIINNAKPYYITRGRAKLHRIIKYTVVRGYNKKGRLMLYVGYSCNMETNEKEHYAFYVPVDDLRIYPYDPDYCF